MAVSIKTKHEIELMREAGRLLEIVHDELGEMIRPGITTMDIDRKGEALIRKLGGIPNFLHYNGYPASVCVSVNEEVVHGIPTDKPLEEGDIVSVDCGTLLNGFNGDSCYTFCVGEVKPEVKALLKTTKESLYLGIQAALPGHRIGDIGYAVQSYCESHGYGVVRELCGHGIGREMHEDPMVPNYGRRGNGMKLQNGLCIAIEPMITMGSHEIGVLEDGWTVVTRDGQPAAHFEHTIAIHNGQPDIMSSFEEVELVEGKLY